MNIMIKKLKIVLLIILTLLLQGCPFGTIVIIYNNTQYNLVIELKEGGKLLWPSATRLRFDDKNMDKLEWITDGGFYIPIIKVSFECETLVYKFIEGGGEEYGRYSHRMFDKNIEYKLQLESDQKWYAVKTTDPFPSKNLYPQPKRVVNGLLGWSLPLEAYRRNVKKNEKCR